MCDFDKVDLDSNLINDCSPSTDGLDLDWEGVLINMPAIVDNVVVGNDGVLSSKTRIPLCITIQFKLKKMLHYDYPREGISVFMEDRETGKTYTNNLAYQGTRARNPKASFSEEEQETSILTKFYSVNLTHYLKIPNSKTIYNIYATFEECKSNLLVLRIE
ncbi:MAG: hypothetical protein OEY00_00975 [Gammaproteobacteria bacterium]|nr:hypothetical protein [Gammaproteobacteria bacterium]